MFQLGNETTAQYGRNTGAQTEEVMRLYVESFSTQSAIVSVNKCEDFLLKKGYFDRLNIVQGLGSMLKNN